MIRASRVRLRSVRMSSSHSPHAESVTALPSFFSTSDQCLRQNFFCDSWVWKPLT